MQFVSFKYSLKVHNQKLHNQSPEIKNIWFWSWMKVQKSSLRENYFIWMSVDIMLYKDLICKMGKY